MGGVFGGFGGGNQGSSGATGWSPSMDKHGTGELHIPLMWVRNVKAEFCLGCIGMDERRFCRSTACNIVSHWKCWHVLECQEGYYIPTSGQKFPRQPSTFKTPLLDVSLLTLEVRAVVTDTGDAGRKTTSEWEEFILQAKVAWHIFQEAARRGHGAGIRKGSNEDDALRKSGISLGDPGLFTFKEPPTFGVLNFGSDVKGGQEGETTDPNLQEIRAAIEELDQKMEAAMGMIKEDQVGIMDQMWMSIQRLGNAANSVKARMQGIEDVVGNAEAALDKHTLADLSKGLLVALGQLDATANPDI